ncbi:hypothetical protein BHM03_00015753 [Ensete ventricosum]|nr:hypothetical protein BHM03_00015753 [Ensete ventricosum]
MKAAIAKITAHESETFGPVNRWQRKRLDLCVNGRSRGESRQRRIYGCPTPRLSERPSDTSLKSVTSLLCKLLEPRLAPPHLST